MGEEARTSGGRVRKRKKGIKRNKQQLMGRRQGHQEAG
jgi:hypothetical protein